jgi:hypothetical protein
MRTGLGLQACEGKSPSGSDIHEFRKRVHEWKVGGIIGMSSLSSECVGDLTSLAEMIPGRPDAQGFLRATRTSHDTSDMISMAVLPSKRSATPVCP